MVVIQLTHKLNDKGKCRMLNKTMSLFNFSSKKEQRKKDAKHRELINQLELLRVEFRKLSSEIKQSN